jgi:hypothetical protein
MICTRAGSGSPVVASVMFTWMVDRFGSVRFTVAEPAAAGVAAGTAQPFSVGVSCASPGGRWMTNAPLASVTVRVRYWPLAVVACTSAPARPAPPTSASVP